MIHLRKISSSQVGLANGSPAFTLTELVVVLGVIVLLTAMLLPALASTKFRDQLAVCTANYRQWGVAWLTGASDNADGSFPLPLGPAGGGDVWDVSLSLVSNMAPYGVTLPMWYCPVRPWQFTQDNAYIQSTFGHPETTLADYIQAVAYAHDPAANFGMMHHTFWIKRFAGAFSYPSTHSGNNPNPNANLGLPWPYDWLRKPSDPGAARIPIMTDQIISGGGSTNLNQLAPGQGHPFGGSQSGALYNDNLVYGDGHVETHQTNSIAWRLVEAYTSWY